MEKTSESPENLSNQAPLLMAGIAWQESILQSYWNYMVITQSIFLAIGMILFNSQANTTVLGEKFTFFVPLIAIIILGSLTLFFLSGAIKERTKTVDWWQR